MKRRLQKKSDVLKTRLAFTKEAEMLAKRVPAVMAESQIGSHARRERSNKRLPDSPKADHRETQCTRL